MSDPNSAQPDEHQDLWDMFITDALPLIVERLNVSERDAYWLWRDHQPTPPGPDVIAAEDCEEEEF